MSVWIEKTIVHQNPLRERYPVGSFLVSPSTSEAQVDIYHFMRDVRPGDIVLHLVDNFAILGGSVARSAWREIEGKYVVDLHDFEAFDPQLDRRILRLAPFAERLLAIATSGRKNLFFTRTGTLRQGAYLTPLCEEVAVILREYYLSLSDELPRYLLRRQQ